MNSGAFLYIWAVHHVVLIAAFIAGRRKLINAVETVEGELVYTRSYYTARRIFTVLAIFFAIYCPIKWTTGWHIDNWWAEATLALIAMTCGHITFIAARNADRLKDTYTSLKAPYISFAFLFILSFYVRLLLAAISLFSYSTKFADSILPDLRKDIYLMGDYYLASSDGKGIVVERKWAMFRKDIAEPEKSMSSQCHFSNFDFAGDDKAEIFPYVQRAEHRVIVLTNPAQKRGYLDFQTDSAGSLTIAGYIYATTDARIPATYMPCGTVYVHR